VIARLGNVLYWLGCIVAAVILALDVFEWFAEGQRLEGGIAMFVVFALILRRVTYRTCLPNVLAGT
jgi:hypothetical protein